MKKKLQKSLFIFRRDLRLEDNTGLIFALKNSISVIPCFILNPNQIENNPYRSDHALQFMIESLEDLHMDLRSKGSMLYLFKGDPEKVVEKCITTLAVEAVIVNRDYTPYSVLRDLKIKRMCEAHSALFYSLDDALLHPPEATLKKDKTPYTVFTPYYLNASRLEVLPPVRNSTNNYMESQISFAQNLSVFSAIKPKATFKNRLKGGRKEALKILENLQAFSDYKELRNFPAENYCSHLSPYLKFTVCSPREVYAAINRALHSSHDLIRSLYWRDFFSCIAFFFPRVFQGCFHVKFNNLKWVLNQSAFEKWCEGNTGFPIVDAGMRQMNETGFMHNRVRMIVASFLTKDLHLDWRLGEKYFAQTLIDYDPAVNNGNWQWAASTGCDAQPYFRIFNPWIQQKKFDPECAYIKKWLPILSDVASKTIHSWYNEKNHSVCPKYPPPMVNHEQEAKTAICLYSQIGNLGNPPG